MSYFVVDRGMTSFTDLPRLCTMPTQSDWATRLRAGGCGESTSKPLQQLGLTCCETNRARAIVRGMRDLSLYSTRGGGEKIDCGKVCDYLVSSRKG